MISVSEISARLAEKALAVSMMLLPGGKEQRSEYVCGSINGGEGDSLKVHLNGGHEGNWKDWANPEHHGDLLDLWRLTRNLSPGEAIQQAKDFLGIRDGASPALKKTYQQPPAKQTPAPAPGGRAYTWLTETRKLLPETLEKFKVSIQSGENAAIIFPCYSPTGELVNRSYRTLPKSGEKKKVWQDAGCAPCMFGWHALPKSAYDSRTVLLTEGQIDAMTWHQWGVPALSIPAGSGQTWIAHEWDNLQAFETLLIAFDMDGAGRENAEKAIKRLGAHRCLLVVIPHKDANEALQAGRTALEAQQWASEAKRPEIRGLITAAALKNRLLADIKPKAKAFTLPFFDKKWPDDGLYFRPAEVTVWTGPYGNGKSTFLNQLAAGILETNTAVFMASMESKAEITLRKLALTFIVGWGFYNTGTCFRNDRGLEYSHDEGFSTFLEGAGEKLIFADVVGYIKQDQLLEMMLFSFRKYGAQHFFIDSLMRIEGLEEDYPAQGIFLNRLQAFAKETGSHIHLVAHPKKGEKGKRPTGDDLKGASLIANNADNIISVMRNHEKAEAMKSGCELTEDERKMHDTEVTVDKQRDSGWVGSFFFMFDRRDFTFSPCQKYQKQKPLPPQRSGRY